MFNSLLSQHDRITHLQTLIDEIKAKGTISMESADLIERLVPGEIKEQDSDIIFDLDESENGLPIAMEAGLAGLSKLKIAFIIAIIAFIGRYVLSLNNNSYSFSASGGGGGWGGSAPPTFTTNKAPTTKECQEEIDDYMDLIEEDIKKLRDEYSEVLKLFMPKVISSAMISSMKDHGKVKFLVNTILPRIVSNNGGGETMKRGFNLFQAKNGAKTKMGAETWAPYLNVSDKDKVTDDQIKKLPAMLTLLESHYNPEKVFLNFYTEQGTLATSFVTGIGLPYFTLVKELRERTLAFIKIINNIVSNADGFAKALDDFADVVMHPTQGGPDLDEGLLYSKPLWQWLSDNLSKDGTSNSAIRKFILEITPLIDEHNEIAASDTSYLNTQTRSRALKKFVKYTIDGDDTSGDPNDKPKIIADSSVASKGMANLLSSHNKESLSKLLDGVLEPLHEVNEELKDNASSIKSFTNTCETLENALANAIDKLKSNQNKPNKDVTHIGQQEKIKLAEEPDDITEEAASQNLPHMLNLTSGLVQMLLMTVAAGAKYNAELNKLTKNRCDLVVGKAQQIAHDYAQLISTLKAIQKDM